MMQSVILQADTLNLPPVFAGRYSGLSLRVVDEGGRLVFTPVREKQMEEKPEESNEKSLARYERIVKKYNLHDCPLTKSLSGIASNIDMTLEEIRAERLAKYERIDYTNTRDRMSFPPPRE